MRVGNVEVKAAQEAGGRGSKEWGEDAPGRRLGDLAHERHGDRVHVEEVRPLRQQEHASLREQALHETRETNFMCRERESDSRRKKDERRETRGKGRLESARKYWLLNDQNLSIEGAREQSWRSPLSIYYIRYSLLQVLLQAMHE